MLEVFPVVGLVCSLIALGTTSWVSSPNGAQYAYPSILDASTPRALLIPVVDRSATPNTYTWKTTDIVGDGGIPPCDIASASLGAMTTTSHTSGGITTVTLAATTVDGTSTSGTSLTTDTLNTTTVTTSTVGGVTAKFDDAVSITTTVGANLTVLGTQTVDTLGYQTHAIPVVVDDVTHYLAVYNRTIATRYPLVALVRHRVAISVAGGTSVDDAWRTRTLNELDDPSGIGVTLASNVVTVPPGVYDLYARTHAHRGSLVSSRIYDATHATALEHSSTYMSLTSTTFQNDNEVQCRLDTDVSTDLILQTYSQSYQATDGYGFPSLYSETTMALFRIIKLE